MYEIIGVQRDGAPSEARLEELERRQSMWEVEMEALVATAKGKYDAANNSEVRTRTMKRHYEKLADPFSEEGEEVTEAVRARDALGGETARVLPLPVDVAADPKTQALRYKFS